MQWKRRTYKINHIHDILVQINEEHQFFQTRLNFNMPETRALGWLQGSGVKWQYPTLYILRGEMENYALDQDILVVGAHKFTKSTTLVYYSKGKTTIKHVVYMYFQCNNLMLFGHDFLLFFCVFLVPS